jgi:hypothetical protein
MTKVRFTYRTLSMSVLAAVAIGFGGAGSAFALSGLQNFAFQDSSNQLRIYENGTVVPTNHYMKSGTIPSLVMVGGGWGIGYQGSNGHFWEEEVNGTFQDTNGSMAAGTSPSITLLSGGLAFGFQAPNGHLWISLGGWNNGHDSGAAMASGTSPSVAALPNGNLAMAFRGSNGDLWVSLNAPGNGFDTNGFIAAGTSPSIAALPNNTIAYAFQGSNGDLWFGKGNGFGGSDTHQHMQAGTSPSVVIDGSSGLPQVIFQYSNHDVGYWVCPNDGSSTCSAVDRDQGPVANTASPTFVYSYGLDYELFYKGSNGDLWVCQTDVYNGCADQNIRMN